MIFVKDGVSFECTDPSHIAAFLNNGWKEKVEYVAHDIASLQDVELDQEGQDGERKERRKAGRPPANGRHN